MALKTENKAANLNIENYMQAVSEEVKSINGVSSMSGSFTDSLPGFKPAIKGVKLSEDAGRLIIDFYINIFYHSNIPRLAWDIQKQVKTRMEEISPDRKSTRLNSSHLLISYAVFCLKKKSQFIH